MSDTTVIDLSKLPIPKVIEELDYEQLFQEYLKDFTDRDDKYDGLLESDPAIVLLESMAYREMLIRKRINESAKANLLAFATDSDLDHIVAEFGVERLEGENNDRLRLRGQMALDGFSTAGPIGAYRFFALSASIKVKSVDVRSDDPGKVIVTILSTENDGTAVRREQVNNIKIAVVEGFVEIQGKKISELVVKSSSGNEIFSENIDYSFDVDNSLLSRTQDSKFPLNTELLISYERSDSLELVELKLNDEEIRPLTDLVSIETAQIVNYDIEANILVYPGPSFAVVENAANVAINNYAKERHALGETVAISGIYQALHVKGVKNVELVKPLQNIETTKQQAAFCQNITLNMEIFNE